MIGLASRRDGVAPYAEHAESRSREQAVEGTVYTTMRDAE